jgi:phosphatidylglycerophosphatase C
MTDTPAPPPRTVAVFDFDHTLTGRDSFGLFCRWLLRRSPWRYALVLATLPITAPLMAWRRTRRPPVQFIVWVSTLGMRHEALGEFIAANLHRFKAPLLDEGMARLARHLEDGHHVVIATGSLELLARANLAAAGHGSIEVVGSSLRGRLGGLVADRHCHGERKIEMLAERGYPPPWDYVYTDNSADLPLLREAKSGFLIDPKARCRARVSAALGRELEVLNWRRAAGHR